MNNTDICLYIKNLFSVFWLLYKLKYCQLLICLLTKKYYTLGTLVNFDSKTLCLPGWYLHHSTLTLNNLQVFVCQRLLYDLLIYKQADYWIAIYLQTAIAINQSPVIREKAILLVKLMQNVEKRFPDEQELNAQFLELVNYIYRYISHMVKFHLTGLN